jgi:hypothetical protein
LSSGFKITDCLHVKLSLILAWQSYNISADIALTECSSGTTQKFIFGINIEIELKNITIIYDYNGSLRTDNNDTLIRHYCRMQLLHF